MKRRTCSKDCLLFITEISIDRIKILHVFEVTHTIVENVVALEIDLIDLLMIIMVISTAS